MANTVDPDQTGPIGAVCSRSALFASILNSSVMLGNYLQQTTFSDALFFLGALRANVVFKWYVLIILTFQFICNMIVFIQNIVAYHPEPMARW